MSNKIRNFTCCFFLFSLSLSTSKRSLLVFFLIVKQCIPRKACVDILDIFYQKWSIYVALTLYRLQDQAKTSNREGVE